MRMRMLVGAFTASSFLATAAAASPSRILVLEGLDLPPHMAEFHARVRGALETSARQTGRDVVATSGSDSCATPDCFRGVARAAGATEVIAIAGGRNDYEGYRLEVQLRRRDGTQVASESGGCNVCSGPEMVAAAESLGRRLLSRSPPEATQPSPLTAGKPALTHPGHPTPARSASASRFVLARDLAVGGLGIVAIAVGAYLWRLDGHPAGCETSAVGETACPRVYSTATLGMSLLIAGGVAAALGAVLVVHDTHESHVDLAIGPGSLALRGAFP